MTYALFSDIHADEQGFALLQKHAAFQAADKRICLGDVINAHQQDGAEDFFRKVEQVADVIVQGNHEAVLCGACAATEFNEKIRADIMAAAKYYQSASPDFVGGLANLPQRVSIGEVAIATHASFDDNHPWRHVRYTEDVQDQATALPSQVNILAHGHVPFIAWQENHYWYYQRQIYAKSFTLKPDTQYVINVGSVLGSREMRHYEKTFVVYDDVQSLVTFYNLEDL